MLLYKRIKRNFFEMMNIRSCSTFVEFNWLFFSVNRSQTLGTNPFGTIWHSETSNSSTCDCKVAKAIDDHRRKSDRSFLERFTVLIHTKCCSWILNALEWISKLTVQTIYNANDSGAVTMHTSAMILTMKSVSSYTSHKNFCFVHIDVAWNC